MVARLLLGMLLALPLSVCADSGKQGWDAFARDFVQVDGRVVDHEADAISTSEGQVYALFFALVADDRERFEKILRWTEDNLAGGDLEAHAMAWKWGRDVQSQWRVLDANAASDAELWLAYVMFEAARIWHVPAWRLRAYALQARTATELVRTAPSGMPLLLPGPQGFAEAKGGWRLNPSYLPLPLLRALAREAPDGPWHALAQTLLDMLGVAPAAVAPDWLRWSPRDGFAQTDGDSVGSYDAIRVYLWAGMTSAEDPLRAGLLKRLGGMHRCIDPDGRVAERINVRTGYCTGKADSSFTWAVLPFLIADGKLSLAAKARVTAAAMPVGRRYYSRALSLFAEAWIDGHFRFAADGRVQLSKEAQCAR